MGDVIIEKKDVKLRSVKKATKKETRKELNKISLLDDDYEDELTQRALNNAHNAVFKSYKFGGEADPPRKISGLKAKASGCSLIISFKMCDKGTFPDLYFVQIFKGADGWIEVSRSPDEQHIIEGLRPMTRYRVRVLAATVATDSSLTVCKNPWTEINTRTR